ncbi:MAG: ATP-binding protein [Dongiaceae bacterium]
MSFADRALRLLLAAQLLIMSASAMASDATFDDTPRAVLILSSEDSLLPAGVITTDTIVSTLRAQIPANLEIFTEFLDSSRRKGQAVDQQMLPYLASKYRGRKLDLIFALGPQALRLLREGSGAPFPDVPTVFVGVGKNNPLLRKPPANVSGVTLQFDLPGTIRLARMLQPGLKRVAVITGASDFDRQWRDFADAALAPYAGQLAVENLAGLPLQELLAKVGNMPADTAILYLTVLMDGNGRSYVQPSLVRQISEAANVPVYGVYSTFLGEGLVGGYMTSFETQGAMAAELGLSVLSNHAGPLTSAIIDTEPGPTVDWRVLQRWGFGSVQLPANIVVRFRPPSLWETHWLLLLATTATLGVQALMITALLIQARRRRKAELLLQEANDQMDVAATSADLGLWSWTPADGKVWMTSHCRSMLGQAAEASIDFDLFLRQLSGQDTESLRTDMLDAVRRNATIQREFSRFDEAGRLHWVSMTGYCIRHEHRFCVTGTLVDVTERKCAQIEAEQQREQLIHLTRVSTLGEISGALAHELNQPLTAISINAQTGERLARAAEPDLGELRDILSDVLQDIRRASAILGRLRSLVRKERVEYESLMPSQIIEDVLTLVRGDLLEKRIEVAKELEAGLPPVRGDRVQIQQVMINLVRNASDAMVVDAQPGHRLTLKAHRGRGDTVVFSVADTGPGIPAQLQEQVFEPFVTTKSQGMGLGLSISRNILVAHGGKIWCTSNPDGGANFGFSLPIFQEEAAWAS